MNKSILAYIALFVILVIMIVVFLNSNSGKRSTTIPTSSAETTIQTNNSNTSIPTTVPQTTLTTTIFKTNYTGCIAKGPTAPIPNGNFSTGNFSRWNTTANGFKLYNITAMNKNGSYYSAPWAGYNGTYFASTYQIGTVVGSGNLTSSAFTVSEPFINFQIVSPSDSLLYVELLRNNSVVYKAHYNSYNVTGNQNASSNFENASIRIVPYLCQNLRIRVVSAVSGNKENKLHYIAVGNFRLSRTEQVSPNILVNQTQTS